MPVMQTSLRRGIVRVGDGVASLTGIVSGAASIWIFCLMILICGDIIGRTFLNAPIQGVSEIVANSIVAIVFLQVAHSLMTGRMTRTDILIGALEDRRPFAAALIRIVFHAAGVVVFGLIAYGTWPKLVDAWVENEFFGAQGVFTAPVWPIKACLFGGSILASIAFATKALGDLKAVLEDGHVAPLKVRHSIERKPRGWPFVVCFVLLVLLGYGLFFAELSRVEIGLVTIGFMLALIFSGMHIALARIRFARSRFISAMASSRSSNSGSESDRQ